MELYLKGKIKDGTIVLLNQESTRAYFLKHEEDYCEIVVKPFKKSITAAQMRWYRGIAINIIITELQNQTGEIWSHEDIHAFNISKIMKPKIRTKEILGETIVETTQFSMKDMSRPQFEWFKNQLQYFWSLRNIDIPDPNEENFLNDEHGIGSIKDYKRKST